jgi:3-methylcrotonyl-CoA carboxylase beta subunit
LSELASALKVASPEYQTNRRAMIEVVDQLRSRVAEAGLGGGASAPARHVAHGKLLPRARVELPLDPGSPFLEFSQLAAYGLYDGEATARLWDDGVIDPKARTPASDSDWQRA